MAFHKIIDNLLLKYYPDGEYKDDERLVKFLTLISSHYNTFERDKKITEHAFTISEKEYTNVTADLKQQNEITSKSIEKLKDAIIHLEPEKANTFSKDDDNIINIISFLSNLIKKSKALEVELITAKEIAEKAALAKTEFLSVMSHEIRTPLNAIIGTIELFKFHTDLDDKKKELLRVMEISSENLLSLINDVLDFSKMEEGKIQFSERDIDLRYFLKNLRLANRIRAEEKGNTIKLMMDDDIPNFVKGDDLRLGQILNNLISNAVKFTKNGTVIIAATLVKRAQDFVEINFEVADTGIGIPEDKQKLIFERFTQANNNITREYGGSGLGLTIIKRLLLLQGSEIKLTSEVGKGSKFYFNLKFKTSSAKSIVEAESDNGKTDLNNLSILLVEDVEFNIFVAEMMLQNWNAKVFKAENGLVAIEMVQANKFDLILMDIQMPIMDGYTATMEIRKFDSSTPIIALTASLSIDIQEKATSVGMNGYITKPFNPNELFDIIKKNT